MLESQSQLDSNLGLCRFFLRCGEARVHTWRGSCAYNDEDQRLRAFRQACRLEMASWCFNTSVAPSMPTSIPAITASQYSKNFGIHSCDCKGTMSELLLL
jgi:hypothetical protein